MIEANNTIVFKNIMPLKGLELTKVRIKFPDKMSSKIGEQVLIPAFGTFESGYSTTACALEQFSEKNPAFSDIYSRLIDFRVGFEDKSKLMGRNLTFLLPIRDTAAYALENNAGEVAARLYALAAQISKDEPIDVLNSGLALLSINNNKAALSRFDDLLEKDSKNDAAWQGRYRALAQMNRWSELPKPLPVLDDLKLEHMTLPADLDLSHASLKNSLFYDVQMSGVDLRGADLSGSMIIESKIKGSHLKGANLKDTYIRDVDFSGTDVGGTSSGHGEKK